VARHEGGSTTNRLKASKPLRPKETEIVYAPTGILPERESDPYLQFTLLPPAGVALAAAQRGEKEPHDASTRH
jgi:hypothetical protein